MTEPATFLAQLVTRFRPDAAQGLRAVYQLHLTGDGGGVWHITVADQKCSLASGPTGKPDAAITMSADDWTELLAGQLDPFSAFLSGRLQVIGDLSLVTRFPSLFGL